MKANKGKSPSDYKISVQFLCEIEEGLDAHQIYMNNIERAINYFEKTCKLPDVIHAQIYVFIDGRAKMLDYYEK